MTAYNSERRASIEGTSIEYCYCLIVAQKNKQKSRVNNDAAQHAFGISNLSCLHAARSVLCN